MGIPLIGPLRGKIIPLKAGPGIKVRALCGRETHRGVAQPFFFLFFSFFFSFFFFLFFSKVVSERKHLLNLGSLCKMAFTGLFYPPIRPPDIYVMP